MLIILKTLRKILRSRMELWSVALLLILATLVFRAFMTDGAERFASRRWSPPGVRQSMATEQRFQGRSGLPPPPVDGEAGYPEEAGYLVVARMVPGQDVAGPVGAELSSDGDDGDAYSAVEIIDLDRRKSVHSWKTGSRVRFHVLPDGSLLAGNRQKMVRMDACSNVVWEQRQRGPFERDADGNFWVPWSVIPHRVPHTKSGFLEDGLRRFSPAGEVLSEISLSGALMRAGHLHLLYGIAARSHGSPFHMNDVEPVLQDGPFWRRGDLFVSLRNSSVILLYRPATDEVIWLQAGPWLHQHDVDILNDSEISVYSNNTVFDERRPTLVIGANEVYVHNFATGETRSPWREAMRRHDVRTAFRGGATLFDDGGVMLEEADYGRILMLSPDGDEVWSYVNRASDGTVYQITASSWLDAEYGAQVMRSIAALDCGAAVN